MNHGDHKPDNNLALIITLVALSTLVVIGGFAFVVRRRSGSFPGRFVPWGANEQTRALNVNIPSDPFMDNSPMRSLPPLITSQPAVTQASIAEPVSCTITSSDTFVISPLTMNDAPPVVVESGMTRNVAAVKRAKKFSSTRRARKANALAEAASSSESPGTYVPPSATAMQNDL